jgi:2-dehydropantoate 2-reductase
MSDATAQHAAPWQVLGAGAMGCLWAARLAAAGQPVCLLLRNAARRAAYHGLTLDESEHCQHLPAPATAVADAPTVHKVLVTTKAYDVIDAVDGLAPHLAADAEVVLMSNGMGFHEALESRYPRLALHAAVTTEGAWLRAPFHVVHAGRGSTVVGPIANATHARSAALAAELAASGLAVKASEDIERALWQKLAVNCAINPLTALHQCPNGALLDDPRRRREFDALLAELVDLLDGLGQHELARDLPDRARAVARATAANRSSMAQDLAAGRRSEIDYLNGFLCRLATDQGLPCPRNLALCQRIREREERCA